MGVDIIFAAKVYDILTLWISREFQRNAARFCENNELKRDLKLHLTT